MTLALLAWISLAVAFASATVIILDEIRRPQRTAIMNIVWPVQGNQNHGHVWLDRQEPRRTHSDRDRGWNEPLRSGVRDSGCIHRLRHCNHMLALFGSVLWTVYVMDFAAAWILGIVFQYFAIKPMRDDLSAAGAIWAAIKADTLSITAFQIGMYAWMALV